MKKININDLFKITLLIYAGYFLFLLTKITSSISEHLENGRYELGGSGLIILDTQKGIVYKTQDKINQ